MKWNKCIIVTVVLFLIAASFSIARLKEATYVKNQFQTVSVRFRKDGITEKKLDKALQNEKRNGTPIIPDITAWTLLSEEEVVNTDLNRKVKLPVELVAGDMSVTAPMTLLHGNYVYDEDKEGCVIDSDTAYGLYGTGNAVGNILNYNKKEYYVRGVVKTTDPLLIIIGDDTTQYTNLEFLYQKKEQAETLTEAFLLQNGFDQDHLMVDSCLYAKLLHSMLILPLWLLLVLAGL